MKKVISLFLALITLFLFCACGAKTSSLDATATKTDAPTSLALTSDMMSDIKELFEDLSFNLKIMMCADAEYYSSDNAYTFSYFDITNQRKTSDYVYTVYGNFYGKDDYGNSVKQAANITFTCVEDSSESSGYSIEWKVKFA
jgi:hypothetical protein